MQIKDSFHQRMLTKKKKQKKQVGRKSFILLKKQRLFFTKDHHIDAGTSSCDSTCMEMIIFMISDLFSLSLSLYRSLFSFVLKQTFVFRDLSAGHPEKDAFVLAV